MDVCFQIRPQEMSEGCFWVRADENQYAKPELLDRVALTFSSQRTGQTPTLCFIFNLVINYTFILIFCLPVLTLASTFNVVLGNTMAELEW